ncbi:MAG: hypothetical protein R6U43_08210 [Candidatus Krumholzibacteriales bacterium]
MMNRRFTVLVLLAVATFIITGCGEDGAVGPEGDKGDPGSPQPIKVLVAGANPPETLQDLIIEATRLEVFPIGTELNYLSVTDSVPPLSALKEYDAVFFHSNYVPGEPAALGDVLADYVDSGGGLVMTQYAFSTNWAVGGRIMTSGYCPFQVADGAGTAGNRQIDPASVSIPIHPIFNGADINNLVFWANSSFSDPPLDADATLLAADLGGANAIAINEDGNIVALNMYATYLNETYYSSAKVMANSCLYVAGAF